MKTKYSEQNANLLSPMRYRHFVCDKAMVNEILFFCVVRTHSVLGFRPKKLCAKYVHEIVMIMNISRKTFYRIVSSFNMILSSRNTIAVEDIINKQIILVQII